MAAGALPQVPRPRFPAALSGLVDGSHWRRLTAGLGAIAAAALAIGIILGTGLPGSSEGASPASKSSGATTVQRRDLVATDTESGTLSYANPQTVFNRLSGTITWLPAIGQVIKAGQTMYKVDGAPVVLFDGTVPAYRDLSEGVSDGADVQELKQNLVALGFDPSHQITINQTFDAATTTAVERWQAALGQTQTGTVTLGQVVFLPGEQRITAINTVLGSTGGAGSAGSSSAAGGSSSGSASGTTTGASTTVVPPRPEFVSLTTKSASQSWGTGASSSAAADDTATSSCPAPSGQSTTSTTKPTGTTPATTCPPTKTGGTKPSGNSSQTLAALIALLKAETLELKKSKTSTGSSTTGTTGGRTSGFSGGGGAGGSASSSGGGGGGRSSGGGGGSGFSGGGSAGVSGGGGGSSSGFSGGGSAGVSGGGGGSGGSSASGAGASGAASSGAATAQAILQTTSTQLVVTVDLDATKQSEAVVGEPVTVELPDGSNADGKITNVSPVAQTSSSSSSRFLLGRSRWSRCEHAVGDGSRDDYAGPTSASERA